MKLKKKLDYEWYWQKIVHGALTVASYATEVSQEAIAALVFEKKSFVCNNSNPNSVSHRFWLQDYIAALKSRRRSAASNF